MTCWEACPLESLSSSRARSCPAFRNKRLVPRVHWLSSISQASITWDSHGFSTLERANMAGKTCILCRKPHIERKDFPLLISTEEPKHQCFSVHTLAYIKIYIYISYTWRSLFPSPLERWSYRPMVSCDGFFVPERENHDLSYLSLVPH